MTPIYVLRHDEPTGPFSEEEVRRQLAGGELTSAEYAWRDGMAEWQPLAEVIALPTQPPPVPLPAVPPIPAARPEGGAGRRTRRVPPVHVMTGLTEFLEVFPDRLTITPKGGLALQAKGAPGIREIPLHLLLNIEYKLPGFTNGYLQLTVAATREDSGGVLFRFTKNTENIDAAGRITAYVEGRVHELRVVPAAMSPTSLSDELAKLAALHSQGVLTAAEFQAAKGRLLT